jgi:hypothetical protein
VGLLRAVVVASLVVGASWSLDAASLEELTVPSERLPAGCALSPADPVRLHGNRVRLPNWAGLMVPTNPWVGTDAPLIATIRERVEGPALLPDGPPPSARQVARFRLQLAEGVEEGYAAIYSQDDGADAAPRDVIVVYGLRFVDAAHIATYARERTAKNPRIAHVIIGPVLAAVHGDGGPCFEAVAAHLKSLDPSRPRR